MSNASRPYTGEQVKTPKTSKRVCPKCRGTGKAIFFNKPCNICQGSGRIRE